MAERTGGLAAEGPYYRFDPLFLRAFLADFIGVAILVLLLMMLMGRSSQAARPALTLRFGRGPGSKATRSFYAEPGGLLFGVLFGTLAAPLVLDGSEGKHGLSFPATPQNKNGALRFRNAPLL